MRHRVRVMAALLLGSIAFTIAPSPAVAAATPRTVVVVLAPYLTWADITSERMPATRELVESATIGDMNIRSSMRFATYPSQSHIALTMSAGSPSAFDYLAPPAHGVDQRLDIGTAGEAYARSMGADPAGAAIVYLGLPRILTAAEEGTFETVPGALGQAVVDAGGSTAAIGVSDGGHRLGIPFRSRPAAILAMDAAGRVQYGSLSSALLTERTDAPYGVTTDLGSVSAAYRDALDATASHGGPALIVLDPGDSERGFNFAVDAAPDAAEAHRVAAAGVVDQVVALALNRLPEDGVLMLVSTGQIRPEIGPSGFGPVIIAGPGYDGGLVTSSSTHRTGLMTDLDVSATVLSLLGIDRPVEVLGNAVAARADERDAEGRIAYLQTLNDAAVAVDTVRPAVQNSYITITVIVLLACAALLRPMERALAGWGGRLARAFRAVILLLLCMPAAATVMYAFARWPTSAVVVAALFAVTTLGLWALALAADRRWGSPVALAAVALGSAGILLADQLLGAPFSYSGMFSYSPLLGARYYGLGNEGASVIVGGGLVGLALAIDAFRDRPWADRLRLYGPVLLAVLVVVAAAAPFFGANIGVIAWGTVAFGILWMHVNGRHITWKTLLVFAGLVVLAVAGFSFVESLSGSGAQTHLGRAWQSAGTGGIAELGLIVARKAETNWRVLRATNWSILMIAILAFLGFMRWRPHGVFAETLKAYPGFAVAMTAALWGSLVGYFTEDSGIVIPALVMLYVTGSLLHIMLSRFREADEGTVSA